MENENPGSVYPELRVMVACFNEQKGFGEVSWVRNLI